MIRFCRWSGRTRTLDESPRADIGAHVLDEDLVEDLDEAGQISPGRPGPAQVPRGLMSVPPPQPSATPALDAAYDQIDDLRGALDDVLNPACTALDRIRARAVLEAANLTTYRRTVR